MVFKRMNNGMNKWEHEAVFITIEGIDGAGKTTQVEQLMQRFLNAGKPCIRTREPGGTLIGDEIRALLLNPELDMNPFTEMYLYAASRAEHVRGVIAPSLEQGVSVICDRFVDASIAYQGYGLQPEGLTPDMVKAVNAPAVAGRMPDLTIIIDIEASVAERRVWQRKQALQQNQDRIERRGAVFYERVRAGLRALYEQNPERYFWIDGNLSPEELTERIWQAVTQL